MRAQRMVFTGHIAGFGTGAGIRMVVGTWALSPFGAFTDVMVQTPEERILVAPTAEVADSLGRSQGAIRATQFRAAVRLRSLLGIVPAEQEASNARV